MQSTQKDSPTLFTYNSKKILVDFLTQDITSSPENSVSADEALSSECVGVRLYDAPLVGVAAATDEGFEALLRPQAVGPHFMPPAGWLPNAKTVISIFFPASELVRRQNALSRDDPSDLWLHARIEGQAYIAKLTARLVAFIESHGYQAAAPCIDARFLSCAATNRVFFQEDGKAADVSFTSNWSERHVAFVCGLGSFGLSKGIITEKGMAGRLTSVVTDMPFELDAKRSLSLYEHCTHCGACVRNCPARAISLKDGKNHALCSDFLDETRTRHQPRYGCGKCQVAVPCENRAPQTGKSSV